MHDIEIFHFLFLWDFNILISCFRQNEHDWRTNHFYSLNLCYFMWLLTVVCVCCHSSIDSKRMDATSFLLQLFHSCRNQSHCKKDDILNSKLTFHRQKQIAIRSKDWSAITMAVEKSGCEKATVGYYTKKSHHLPSIKMCFRQSFANFTFHKSLSSSQVHISLLW